jgi:pilus assembly protein CpaD
MSQTCPDLKLSSLSQAIKRAMSGLVAVMVIGGLAACSTAPQIAADKAADFRAPNPKTPIDQYPIESAMTQQSLNFRANPQGLSDNQRRALDQLAAKMMRDDGAGRDVELIVNPDARSAQSAEAIRAYLIEKVGPDAQDHVQWINRASQPSDIVTLNLVSFRSHIYACNQAWENLSKTAKNEVYRNFGCTVNSNIAAQIADPRDLSQPHTADAVDMGRRSVVLDTYRKGKDTATEVSDSSKVKISSAIQ